MSDWIDDALRKTYGLLAQAEDGLTMSDFATSGLFDDAEYIFGVAVGQMNGLITDGRPCSERNGCVYYAIGEGR